MSAQGAQNGFAEYFYNTLCIDILVFSDEEMRTTTQKGRSESLERMQLKHTWEQRINEDVRYQL